MNAFSLVKPRSLAEASALLGDGRRPLAGGTDLVPLIREGLVRAESLVDVRALVPSGIEEIGASPAPLGQGRTRIGAGTTLAELERSERVPRALREACRLAASPQLRNMGTIGGNLRQATRCWYWRLAFPCYLHGGERCHAREGEHREHAIFAADRCASAHPSDPAAALLALAATIETDRRRVALRDLYRLPSDEDRDVVALEPGELILALDVPSADASVYLKAMDRQAWSFPLVGVAAARFSSNVRLALAGVAPIPWELPSQEALDDATPLPGTTYKVEIAKALVRRALAGVGADA
ncbi:MAG: FAD binding domain-containing protein [Actinomycetota bacterium]|nr:FAD binding domain-containing protein [Actinomycetota bacterium]